MNRIPPQAIEALRRALSPDRVLHTPEDLLVFEYDGTIEKGEPQVVVFPDTTAEVSACVRIARQFDLPVVPRGAGTGLSGGAVAAVGGVLIAMTRMHHILEVDVENSTALVEPGVVNLHLSQAVAQHGLYYAPDPSSQRACTIGGNVAENAGGPHCLAYGVTTNHVLGLEVVTADGEVVWTGGAARDLPGYDLPGIIVGSEGTLCIVTKALVRLLRLPESVHTLLAAFESVEAASTAVSSIIGGGLVPAAMEMLDRVTIDAGRTGAARRLPAGRRRRAADRGRRTRGVVRTRTPRGRDGSAANAAPPRCAKHRRRRSASSSGPAAKARLAPWARWRRTTTSSTASCRAQSCRR